MGTEAKVKRPRGIATQNKLVAAAIEALIEDGYVGATTTNIVARAGVSQGALFKHFSSKNDLLAAALTGLFAGLRQEFREEMAERRHEDRLAAGLRLFWQLCHSPRLPAAFELYLAARTDEELASRIRHVLVAHRAAVTEQAISVFPEEIQAHPDLGAVVVGMINMVQGGAMVSSVIPSAEADADGLATVERFIRCEVARLVGASES
ncbi:MAG: TetR/AcrR family transcriptional regulator [Myxococcota bacterium]